jgi:hypothetical protein
MLWYESSKLFHGHPKKFHGSWHSSVLVHYYPQHWNEQNHELEAHYAVPPHWSQSIEAQPEDEEQNVPPPRLEMVGSSMKEPDCPNEWCATLDSVKWSGPGEAGKWIAPTLERFPFELQQQGDWSEGEL